MGLAAHKPERKTNRTDEIRTWIETAITTGQLTPGARLDEQALAEQFGVSKTPVREALIQLSSVGLVDMRQRRGVTVTLMSVKQVISMLEVATELEGLAAKLAARRMDPDARQRLQKAHEDSRPSVEAQDVDAYDRFNKIFHEIIYDGAHNEHLAAHVRELRAKMRLYRRYPFQKTGQMNTSFRQHGEILSAILAGDGDEADRLMQDHMTTGGQIFADLVAELPYAAQPD